LFLSYIFIANAIPVALCIAYFTEAKAPAPRCFPIV